MMLFAVFLSVAVLSSLRSTSFAAPMDDGNPQSSLGRLKTSKSIGRKQSSSRLGLSESRTSRPDLQFWSIQRQNQRDDWHQQQSTFHGLQSTGEGNELPPLPQEFNPAQNSSNFEPPSYFYNTTGHTPIYSDDWQSQYPVIGQTNVDVNAGNVVDYSGYLQDIPSAANCQMGNFGATWKQSSMLDTSNDINFPNYNSYPTPSIAHDSYCTDYYGLCSDVHHSLPSSSGTRAHTRSSYVQSSSDSSLQHYQADSSHPSSSTFPQAASMPYINDSPLQQQFQGGDCHSQQDGFFEFSEQTGPHSFHPNSTNVFGVEPSVDSDSEEYCDLEVHSASMSSYYDQIEGIIHIEALKANRGGSETNSILPLPSFFSPREFTLPINPSFFYESDGELAYSLLNGLQKLLVFERIMAIRPLGKENIRKKLREHLKVPEALDLLSYDVRRIERAAKVLFPASGENSSGKKVHYMTGLTNSQRRQVLAKFAEDTEQPIDHLREQFSHANLLPAISTAILQNTKSQNVELGIRLRLGVETKKNEKPWQKGTSSFQRKSLLYRMQNVSVDGRVVSSEKTCSAMLIKSHIEDGYGLKMIRANEDQFASAMRWLRSSRKSNSPI